MHDVEDDEGPAPERTPADGMLPVDKDSPLINAALPLLALINTLPRLETPVSVSAFYDGVVHRLQHFQGGVQHADAGHAALILAATLDERVMATPWGGQFWLGETLCSRLFNRRDAGRYAFEIIDDCLKYVERHQELLFLSFLCIKLGFSGQFNNGNREALNALQANMYHLFAKSGRLHKSKLMATVSGQEYHPLSSFSYRRSWSVFAASLVLLLIAGSVLIFGQKDVGIASLEDARNITSQPTDGYQLTTKDAVYELLFNKNH